MDTETRARKHQADGTLGSGDSLFLSLVRGENAIQSITCDIEVEHEQNLPDALRSLIITAEFDDEQTVWCPFGDFFGSGIGLNEFEDWYRTVTSSGRGLQARWVMPYQKSAVVRFENHGEHPVKLSAIVNTVKQEWIVGRSMHFHARWCHENPIPTRPMRDWNYVEIEGEGVYVGDSLAVANPVETWWGEGDEKIYVDGETFPSHFGTGTEDYYGYAWCCPETFTGPFHAQPRCDGPGNYGHTSVSRVRMLDAIPFKKSFKLDMEVWHWADCNVGYAATTFFYAKPGTKVNRSPLPDEAARGALNPPPLPPPFTIENAIECEKLQIVEASEGLELGEQAMKSFARNTWSNDAHLWVRGREPGDYVMLEIPCERIDAGEGGPVRVTLHATKSWDYGIIQCSINGKNAGDPIDTFSGEQGKCVATGPIDLGTFMPVFGKLSLRVEVIDGHPDSLGSKSFFGLDCIVLEPAK